MNLRHRITVFFALRRADKLLERHRKPHRQSVHMISYPVEQRFGVSRRYYLLVVVAVAMLIYGNVYSEAPKVEFVCSYVKVK